MERLIRIIPIIILCTIGIGGCKDAQRTKVLKLAHGLNTTHPVHLGMLEMSRILEEVSQGQMTLNIYANGQLGQERDLLELLQIGSVDMTKVSSNTLGNFVPQIKVLTLPYIFEDSAHTWSILQGDIGRVLLNKLDKYKLHGLCFYDAGSRSFYSKDKPINDPNDLSGLKIRVMNSQSSVDMVSALGGSPTPVTFGELYTALQQGVVDAAENNPPSFYTSKHYEICKYYSIDEHTTIPDVLVISSYLWKRLSKQEKEWLQLAANQSVIYQKKLWSESVRESLQKVEEAGVTISYPNKSPFQKKVDIMYKAYQSDPSILQLINQIQKVGKKTESNSNDL